MITMTFLLYLVFVISLFTIMRISIKLINRDMADLSSSFNYNHENDKEYTLVLCDVCGREYPPDLIDFMDTGDSLICEYCQTEISTRPFFYARSKIE